MTWHIPDKTLRAYVTDRVEEADAWSVEAHLISCEPCRGAVAAHAAEDADRAAGLDRTWTALAPQLGSQGSMRGGSRWREVRMLVAGGPAARWAWLAACALVVVFAAAVGAMGMSDVPWLGVAAPVVPLLGVAASYGSGLDDAYEVIATTPAGGLRLLLIRSAVVLAVTTPVALAGGVVSGYGSPAPWLLACLALTLLTLALGSAVGVERAAVVVGLGWIVVVSATSLTPDEPVPVVLTPDAGPALLAVIVATAAVLTVRRGAFNHLPVHHRIRIEASL